MITPHGAKVCPLLHNIGGQSTTRDLSVLQGERDRKKENRVKDLCDRSRRRLLCIPNVTDREIPYLAVDCLPGSMRTNEATKTREGCC